MDPIDMEVERLHVAAASGMTDRIRESIDRGVNVNALILKETALNKACRDGNYEAVVLLLQHGANVDGVEGNSCTPLQSAFDGIGVYGNSTTPFREHPHFTIAKLLVEEHGANLNIQASICGTALHTACFTSSKVTLEIVKWILEYPGVDVDARDSYGQTPLHLAIQGLWKKTECTTGVFEHLLAAGADILCTFSGMTYVRYIDLFSGFRQQDEPSNILLRQKVQNTIELVQAFSDASASGLLGDNERIVRIKSLCWKDELFFHVTIPSDRKTLFAHVCKHKLAEAILALVLKGADENDKDDDFISMRWPVIVAEWYLNKQDGEQQLESCCGQKRKRS